MTHPVVSRLLALDGALVERRFPAMSPWWRDTLVPFYESGRRQLVLRCGRRGGKSSTLCRVAVCEALYGEHAIPPGDVGIVAIVSVRREEANERLRTIKAILDILGVAYRPVDSGIELLSRPIVFRVFTASTAGVVGGTVICAICDEVARWRDADTGANPATEVLGSLRPALATQPNARIFLSSSPLSTLDAHYDAFEAGANEFQLVAYAPTWIANPTVTEEETHALEPDPRVWAREYKGIPSCAVSAAFDADAIERAFMPRRTPDRTALATPVLIIDPSSGGADSWTWGVARYVRGDDFEIFRLPWWPRDHFEVVRSGRGTYLKFDEVDGIDGGYWGQVSADQIVAKLAATARREGIRAVHSDQREAFALAAAFERAGLKFYRHDWTAANKPAAVEIVRRWLRDGRLSLPSTGKADKMKRELLAFEERFTPSGQITFRGRGAVHDDYVALLLTCALADIDPGLPSSPNRKPSGFRMSDTPIGAFDF